MTDQEREQVLKMIENGKISPEDGLKLIRTFNETPVDDDLSAGNPGTGTESGPDMEAKNSEARNPSEQGDFGSDPRIEQVKSTVRKLWQIPLWVGVFITVLSAWGMYALVQSANLNFWFYFLTFPLLIGVLFMVAAVGSRKARWLFVDVHQKAGERPARIFLGFPLPLKLAAWFLRTFGRFIPDLQKSNMDGMIQVIESGFIGEEPLVVNVDEGDEGDRVRVYIG